MVCSYSWLEAESLQVACGAAGPDVPVPESLHIVHGLENPRGFADRGTYPVFRGGGVSVRELGHQTGDIKLGCGLLARVPAENAADDPVDCLTFIVVGPGLHVVTFPSIVPVFGD